MASSWTFTHDRAVGRMLIDDLHHRLFGFGYNSADFPTDLTPSVTLYTLCLPLWFVALGWLLFAYLFFCGSRRRQLNTGQGFEVLPAKPKRS